MDKSLRRVLRALHRMGLAVERDGTVVRVRSLHDAHAPTAEVLLPEDHRLDGKALKQLAGFAAVRHPKGGEVRRAIGTPDFHPGTLVPVGCVIATSPEIVVPEAIGTDIYCGMRLHVADLTIDELLARRDDWLPALKTDLLLGTRDLPMRVGQVRAMLRGGPLAWVEEARRDPLGLLARADLDQLEKELESSFELGSADGDPDAAPRDMLPDDRDVVRDALMGTIGGGNHFVELQVVDEVIDRDAAFQWGIRKGQIAIMAHSGSRRVGVVVGSEWARHAREAWPAGEPLPDSGVLALHGEAAQRYVTAMSTAANYAAVNRLLLVEMVRDRLRAAFGRELEAPLLFDAPHNIVRFEDGMYVHRKGATPAFDGDPVLIPGSMGQPSYVLRGLGNPRFLRSASHGAGRRLSRGRMFHLAKRGEDLGLAHVECITLKEERVVEEAPIAYKDIGPIVQVQADAGIATPAVRLRPILTFKG